MKTTEVGMNRTTERSMAILQLIANSENGITLQEISRQMDIAKSSASVIVHTLRELNYIKTAENNDKKYFLGVETFTLGMKYLNELSFVKQCAAYLPTVAEKYNRTAFVAVLNGPDVIYVYKYKAQNALLATCAIGSSKPAYATALGKAIIAFLPEAEQDAILSQTDFIAFTKNTITSPASFKEELLITKQRGYAKEHGELEDITTCCSAPIFDFSGRVIAAISFSDIYSKVKEEQEQALIHDLLSVSGEISKSLGYIPHS